MLGSLCDASKRVYFYNSLVISQLTLFWYFVSVCFSSRLQEMEILYKKEKEEADLLLEQQRLVGVCPESAAIGKGICSHTS